MLFSAGLFSDSSTSLWWVTIVPAAVIMLLGLMKHNHWWFPVFRGPRTQDQRYRHLWAAVVWVIFSILFTAMSSGVSAGSVVIVIVLTATLNIGFFAWIYASPVKWAYQVKNNSKYATTESVRAPNYGVDHEVHTFVKLSPSGEQM